MSSAADCLVQLVISVFLTAILHDGLQLEDVKAMAAEETHGTWLGGEQNETTSTASEARSTAAVKAQRAAEADATAAAARCGNGAGWAGAWLPGTESI